MRRISGLALLAACATSPKPLEAAGLEDEVRTFLAGYAGVAPHEIALGPASTAADRLEAERSYPGESGRFFQLEPDYAFLALELQGDTAEVVHVASGTPRHVGYSRRVGEEEPRFPDSLTTPSGHVVSSSWAWRGTVPRADFERLARKVALVEAARLPEPQPPALEERVRESVKARFSVRVGDGPRIASRSSEEPDEDGARAELIFALVFDHAKRWASEEVRDTDLVAPFLLRELATMPESLRRSERVKALGNLGCGAAIPVLESLDEDWVVSVVIERIRLLQECRAATRAPAQLVSLAEQRQPWALALLATRFPVDCHAVLYGFFESADRGFRSDALRDLAAYDPADLTLARQALEDPDPGLRVIGAFLLDDAEPLLAIARDATLPRPARRAAIQALTLPRHGEEPMGAGIDWWRDWRSGSIYRHAGGWRSPPGDRQVTGAALVALLEDPDVGSAAVAGIADLGYRDGSPPLLAAMQEALHDRAFKRAVEIALALGRLGAKDAVEPLCDAVATTKSAYFQEHAGHALALTGDPRARACLNRQVEISRTYPIHAVHKENLATLDAILRRDAKAILRRVEDAALDCPEPRYLAELFADLFTTPELLHLKKEARAWSTVILERALELREGRE